MLSFRQRVLGIVAAIPRGSTMSYGEVAAKAGSPGAARAVGSILSANTDKTIPCHRVIRADGSLGKYNGLIDKRTKESLLGEEKLND